jgi:pyroglutamyl-peptidase
MALVRRLARLRRPALSDVRLVGHIFPTSYAAVDRELPALIGQHRPDAIVMFGLAARAPFIRIETLARNAIVARPDAGAAVPTTRTIDARGPQSRRIRAPLSALVHAARSCGVPTDISRDAGRYVCNYAYWRGLEHAAAGGPSLVVFVHVPKVRTGSRPARMHRGGFTSGDLDRAGRAIVLAVAAALRRPAPAARA